jgi:hypothetical protein
MVEITPAKKFLMGCACGNLVGLLVFGCSFEAYMFAQSIYLTIFFVWGT